LKVKVQVFEVRGGNHKLVIVSPEDAYIEVLRGRLQDPVVVNGTRSVSISAELGGLVCGYYDDDDEAPLVLLLRELSGSVVPTGQDRRISAGRNTALLVIDTSKDPIEVTPIATSEAIAEFLSGVEYDRIRLRVEKHSGMVAAFAIFDEPVAESDSLGLLARAIYEKIVTTPKTDITAGLAVYLLNQHGESGPEIARIMCVEGYTKEETEKALVSAGYAAKITNGILYVKREAVHGSTNSENIPSAIAAMAGFLSPLNDFVPVPWEK